MILHICYLLECMVSHIFWWYILFYFFIFQCGVFPCLSLSWHGLVFRFARELLAPSWCCALFCPVFCPVFLVHIVSGFLHGEDVLLFMWCVCCMLWLIPILSEMDYGLLENDFVRLTSDSLTTLVATRSLHVSFLQFQTSSPQFKLSAPKVSPHFGDQPGFSPLRQIPGSAPDYSSD